MRNSYHYGRTVGAKVTELRRGSVNSVSIGCVERHPIDGSITLRLSCRVVGKPAKALAATLYEISISCARGRDHDGAARRTIRRGDHQPGAERPVLKTPLKAAPENGGNAGLGSGAFGCPTTSTIEDVNNVPHDRALPTFLTDRDPEARCGGSISLEA